MLARPFDSLILLATTLLVVLGSATPTTLADDAGVNYFEKHVRPILASRCYSCHSARAKKSEGGLRLDTAAGWEAGGDSGAAIVPRDANASLLVEAIRYQNSDLQMPPDKPLPKAVVARIEHWVELGAPHPSDKHVQSEATGADPSDPIAGRTHWAFQPLDTTPLPDVAAGTKANGLHAPNGPIDLYVDARLHEAQLVSVELSDRRTLARRVYVQITGLPPSIDELASFLNDERPDAYERLVDKLLSSPRYGERWGRHWLDLARYADSNGLDENFLFREAWRYRNWVIAATNVDVPFDRFLLEQIAGDLLPHDSMKQRDQQRTAAGFLVVGPKVLLGNNPEERRMDVADEIIDTIGRAVLGQTLGCARCHDHKFDPVPTADYYSLAGIFTSTTVMERRYMLGQQRLMERLVGLGPSGADADNAYETYWRERPQRLEKLKRATSALELLKKDDAKSLADLVRKHPSEVAESAANTTQKKEARVAAQQQLVNELAAAAKNVPIPPRAMIPCDAEKPADEAIRLAGRFDRHGERVPRGFLRVVSDHRTTIPKQESGRRQLANWLTDTEHGAGELAARVQANRVWRHVIGRGLVRTVDNFGRAGERPSHPLLLDRLARELIGRDWSMKSLVRQVVQSRTFRLSSRHDDASDARDPDNKLLWRSHRRRLDPESMRDSMLFVAQELDLQWYDSTVSYLGDQATAVGDNKNRRRTDFPCRSVYLPVIRNDLPELFDVFDFADPHVTTGMRTETMVATQALFSLNDVSMMQAATATAKRILASDSQNDDERICLMFEVVLGATAETEERSTMLHFIQHVEQRIAKSMAKRTTVNPQESPELQAWGLACHALFASSRFQMLE